jgi:NTP pyrophosphatase (non-canonical NTP hydrolase)
MLELLTFEEMEDKVIQWAHEKGIIEKGTREKQSLKSLEEVGELVAAVHAQDQDEIIDAIGDVAVTIIIQAYMNNTTVTECLFHAYNVIANRTGEMKNGTFVKD